VPLQCIDRHSLRVCSCRRLGSDDIRTIRPSTSLTRRAPGASQNRNTRVGMSMGGSVSYPGVPAGRSPSGIPATHCGYRRRQARSALSAARGCLKIGGDELERVRPPAAAASEQYCRRNGARLRWRLGGCSMRSHAGSIQPPCVPLLIVSTLIASIVWSTRASTHLPATA
jgi:hypothetical protein